MLELLLSPYRFHRSLNVPRINRSEPLYPMRATTALQAARIDVEAGKTRYGASRWVKPIAAVTWANKLAHIADPEKAGLRFVGKAHEFGLRSIGHTGWHTDIFGDLAKEGDGLCWGVVYQLPGRSGKARFVAGYQFGGTDAGPTLDLGKIYKGESYWDGSPPQCDAAQQAARAADSMAEKAADEEREYQTAWQAGVAWSNIQDEISKDRSELLELLAERRAYKGDRHYPALCRAIRSAVGDFKQRISTGRRKAELLAEGDSDTLQFWPGEQRLKDAFNEGAGRVVIS